MNLRGMTIAFAVVNGLYALGNLIAPDAVMGMYGADLGDAGVWIMRLFGAAMGGLAVMAWQARGTGESEARWAMVDGFITYAGLGAVASLFGQLSGLFNPFGWSTVVLFAVFLAGFAWLRFGTAAT